MSSSSSPGGEVAPGLFVPDPRRPAPGGPNRRGRRLAVRDDRQIRRNPRYRRLFCDRVNHNPTLRSVAKDVAMVLVSFSDDSGKPVWPSQQRLAGILGRDVRTVRRAIAELEGAGYLRIVRHPPERNRRTGRYFRRFNNYHYFCLPQGAVVGQRRVRRACSHLEDTQDRLTPSGGISPPLPGGGDGEILAHDEPPSDDSTDSGPILSRHDSAARFRAAREALQATLRRAPPRTTNPT